MGKKPVIENLPVEMIHQTIVSLCRASLIVTTDEVRTVLDEISRMDSVMPIVNPTGYRGIMENIDDHREMVEAFAEFRGRLEKLKERK